MSASSMDSDRIEGIRSGDSTRSSIRSNTTSARSLQPKPSFHSGPATSEMQLQRTESKLGLRSIFKGGNSDQNSSHKKMSFSSLFLAEEPTRAALNAIRMEANIKTPTRTAANQLPTRPKTPPRQAFPNWDPPPLCEAFPQSIKHAALATSNLPSESIIRMNSSERKYTLPENLAKAEWTQKIYVLVAQGYLLQYSGYGSFERLPEKIMQLGKPTVAFASDAIPGRPFVVQVAQATDADGTPASSSQSLFSRIGVAGADDRKSANSFLLVLDNAEEMESWLYTLQREIEAWGGKKHFSETGKPKFDVKVRSRERPRRKVVVPKIPGQIASPPNPGTAEIAPQSTRNFKYLNQLGASDGSKTLSLRSSTDGSVATSSTSYDNQGRDSSISSSYRHSNASSGPTSLASCDGLQLDSLRNSMHRYSQASSGQRTMMTSPGSSTPSSPNKDKFTPDDVFMISILTDGINQKANASTGSDRRTSTQASNDTIHAAHTKPIASHPQRQSSVRRPRHHVVSPSASASDFSVSSSLNKRGSADSTVLGVWSPVSTLESVSENRTRFKQKGLSAPLLARPLSPVQDFPSPTKTMRNSLTNPITKSTDPDNPVSNESAVSRESQSPIQIASPSSKLEQRLPSQAPKTPPTSQSPPRPRILSIDSLPPLSPSSPNSLSPPLSPPPCDPLPLPPGLKRRPSKLDRAPLVLVTGPPLAPPPDCALPPLPKAKSGTRKASLKGQGAGRKERKKRGDEVGLGENPLRVHTGSGNREQS